MAYNPEAFQNFVSWCGWTFIGLILICVGLALFLPQRKRVWAIVLFCISCMVGSIISVEVLDWLVRTGRLP